MKSLDNPKLSAQTQPSAKGVIEIMKNIFWISVWCGILVSGCSSRHNFGVLVENQTPVSTNQFGESGPSIYHPLICEVVGVANLDGSFEPIKYLGMPLGGGAGHYPIHLSTNSTFKVYRGTNLIAAKNKFLGEFKVQDSVWAEPAEQARIDFDVSTNRQLSVHAYADAEGNKPLKIMKILSQN